jgi:hypothetical protein
MSTPVIWVTDDSCPACGGQLTQSPTDASVTQECRCCGWVVTWAPEPTGGER